MNRPFHLQILAVIATLAAGPLLSRAPGQGRFTTLYTFSDGGPLGLTAANGALYGATQVSPGGGTCGMVFELQPPATPGGAWTETVLYTFAGANDACNPSVGPILGASDVLYGLTEKGGAYGAGALYELEPPVSPGGPWTESVAFSFGPESGVGAPYTNVTPGPDGSLYVMTSVTPWGSLAQLQPPASSGGAWTGTVLYNLSSGSGAPSSLVTGPHGVLYGTLLDGGPVALGQVIEFTPPAAPGGSWTQTVLHNFGFSDGHASGPNSLTVASDGTIYGTAVGASIFTGGAAAVFALTPPASPGGAWGYAVLKNFGRGAIQPNSPLILRSGNLYGASWSSPGGFVFELQPPSVPGGAWTTTYLHSFTNGQKPGGTLVLGGAGTIYGATFVQPTQQQQPEGTVYSVATK